MTTRQTFNHGINFLRSDFGYATDVRIESAWDGVDLTQGAHLSCNQPQGLHSGYEQYPVLAGDAQNMADSGGGTGPGTTSGRGIFASVSQTSMTGQGIDPGRLNVPIYDGKDWERKPTERRVPRFDEIPKNRDYLFPPDAYEAFLPEGRGPEWKMSPKPQSTARAPSLPTWRSGGIVYADRIKEVLMVPDHVDQTDTPYRLFLDGGVIVAVNDETGEAARIGEYYVNEPGLDEGKDRESIADAKTFLARYIRVENAQE